MEPVDPVDDYLLTRGTIRRNVTLSVFSPLADQASTDPTNTTGISPAIPIRGSRGEKRVTTQGVGDGSVTVTQTTWTITARTSDDPPLPRPILKSQITNEKDVWSIESITSSPRNGQLFVCECLLVNQG